MLVACACAGTALDARQIHLSNPLNVDRTAEVIEVPLHDVMNRLHISAEQTHQLVASDTRSGQRIPSQVYSDKSGTAPDTLLLLVQLPAKGSEDISLKLDPDAPVQEALVFGREAQERKDDFAWENQLVAYRIYGPALEATGEITSGIDVWSKRVPNFVIDNFYKRDLEGSRTHKPSMSYHVDSGQGLDSYFVGKSRGCGGTAVFADNKLFVSNNYTTMRILSEGPIRFAFEVSYAPWNANGTMVTETKRVTLDAGTHLNRIESWYSFHGVPSLTLAAGIAVHDGATARFPISGSVASVWDTPQLASAGRIGTGLVAVSNQHAQTIEANGHALITFQRRSGEPFTYYAGSGWSKADMPTQDAWETYLKTEQLQLEHPIAFRWK